MTAVDTTKETSRLNDKKVKRHSLTPCQILEQSHEWNIELYVMLLILRRLTASNATHSEGFGAMEF